MSDPLLIDPVQYEVYALTELGWELRRRVEEVLGE